MSTHKSIIVESGWAALESVLGNLSWLHCFASTREGVWDQLLRLHNFVRVGEGSTPWTRRQLQRKLSGRVKLVRAEVRMKAVLGEVVTDR